MVGNTIDRKTCVATPIRVCNINGGRQGNRIYSTDAKSCAIKSQGGGMGGHGQGLYAIPADKGVLLRNILERSVEAKTGRYTVPTACPALRVTEATAKGYTDILPGECVDLTMPNSKTRRGRAMREKANCLTTSCQYYQYCGTLDRPIYEVRDGQITIKGQQYPIKLMDGYILRPAGLLLPLFLPQDIVNTSADLLGFFHFPFQREIPPVERFPFSGQLGILMLNRSMSVSLLTSILNALRWTRFLWAN